MVMSKEGTFCYVFEVPDDGARVMHGRLAYELPPGEERLLGPTVQLEITEVQRQPWQLFATLALSSPRGRVWFTVERGMIRVLRKGDSLYIQRGSMGGLGIWILRADFLVAAAGGVFGYLGKDVSVGMPCDLIERAEAALREGDPKYRMHDRPVELRVGGEIRILHVGRPRIGPYDIHVRHGFIDGLPGTGASLSIERVGVCPDTAAHTTAQLLDEEGYEMELSPPRRIARESDV